MLSRRSVTTLLSVTLLALVITGCSKHHKTLTAPDTRPTIPASNVHVIATPTLDAAAYVAPLGDTLIFNSGQAIVDSLRVGQVIVSIRGAGFLRSISSIVSTGGATTIVTSPAHLTDAFQRVSFSQTRRITQADLQQLSHNSATKVRLRPNSVNTDQLDLVIPNVVVYDADENLATTDDQVIADGIISLINVDLNLSMSIDNFALQSLEFTVSGTVRTQLTFTSGVTLASLSRKFELIRAPLPPIIIPAGPIPIVLQPMLSLDVGASGKVGAQMSFRTAETCNLNAGVRYGNGSWQPIASHTESFDFLTPQLGIEADAKCFGGPQFNLLLYGVVGPYQSVYLFGEAIVTPIETPWWTLWAGAEVGCGVRIDAFCTTLADYSKPDLVQVRVALAHANMTPACSVTPDTLMFGQVPVGALADRIVTITNIGGGSLVGTVTSPCADFTIVGDGSYSLGPTASKQVTLRFRPTSTTHRVCTVNCGSVSCGTLAAIGDGRQLSGLRGYVVDASSKIGINDATVAFSPVGGAEVDTTTATNPTTQHRGYFAFPTVPPGHGDLYVNRPGFRQSITPFTVPDTGLFVADIQMTYEGAGIDVADSIGVFGLENGVSDTTYIYVPQAVNVKFYIKIHNYNYWGSSHLAFYDRPTKRLLHTYHYENAPFWTPYLGSNDIMIVWYPGMAYAGAGTGYAITHYNYYN